MTLNDTFHNIIQTTKSDKKDFSQTIMKFYEELGEFSEALLVNASAPGTKYKHTENSGNDVLEEGCDVIMIIVSLIQKSNPEVLDSDIKRVLDSKIQKWQRHI